MQKTDSHLDRWDIRVLRDYNPFYFLTGERYVEHVIPPVEVQVTAVFASDEAALDFEREVRELLEKA